MHARRPPDTRPRSVFKEGVQSHPGCYVIIGPFISHFLRTSKATWLASFLRISQCDLNWKSSGGNARVRLTNPPTTTITTFHQPTPLCNEGRLRRHLIGIMSRVLHGSHLLIQYAAVFTRMPGDVNEFCQTSSYSPSWNLQLLTLFLLCHSFH